MDKTQPRNNQYEDVKSQDQTNDLYKLLASQWQGPSFMMLEGSIIVVGTFESVRTYIFSDYKCC